MIKKALALAFAAAIVLSLAACDKSEKKNKVTENTPIDNTPAVTEDIPPEDIPAPSFSVIAGVEEIAEYSGEPFGKVPGTAFESNDKYGRISQTDFIFQGGDTINVLDFADEESAKKYAGYYNEDGDQFSSSDEFMMLCYAMPIRMWQKDNQIVTYASSGGSLYSAFVSLLGEPFVSGGDFYSNAPTLVGENDKANELIVTALEANSQKYEAETYELEPDGEDGLGAVSEDYYSFDNGDSISIVTFESAEKASEYFACFKDNGSTWDNGEVSVDMEYEAPAHLWLVNSQVVTYCSDSGEFLDVVNGAIGFESMGAGYDYFLPEYAHDLTNELAARGISFKCRRAVLVPNPIYMYSPKSVCVIESGINMVYVSQYVNEAEAKDHAARFSPDGRFYTGLEGQSRITIGFGRQYPIRLFRKDSVIAEYSAADDSLLPALEKVYGTQFAGNNGNADAVNAVAPVQAQNMDYEADFIRTDGYNGDAAYPRYAIIRSKEELDVYYSAHREVYDLERHEKVYADSTIGFLDKADKYTAEWFDNNDLVLILLEEGSGSIRHEVRGVVKEADGSYTVSVTRLCPEGGTDDMAEWHLFLEMNGCKLNPLAKINVDISKEDT